MNSIRLALGAVAVCLAMPAAAVPVPPPTTFNFMSESAHTGADAWSNAAPANYNPINGTNYGNTRSFMGVSGLLTPVSVSAWGSTGGVGGFGGTLQTGYVGVYGSNDLGVTSRPISGNAELNSSNNPNTGNNQHAIDNTGGYESLLFSFQSAVTLNSVSIGFPSSGSSLDSDATVLVYTGSAEPTSGFSIRTYDQLLSTGNWQIAGNLFNLAKQPGSTGALSTSFSSKYWMVGAFMNIGGNTMITHDSTADFIKINGITVTPKLAVPEPDSLALLGIASLGLLFRRRKGARAV